ncbi:Gnk2-homologous domain [Arabidopsis thaliana x Arabidopsis arenosa]|uniref:Gnk2-homologous domain n=2 Tax=Arabidopsis TaxID=3701 RepID=A0A8T2FB10_ARASU|nr:Gnk2-homologous domain [Arabidopsis thaliana x Arabidopsis arenosa]KAG7632134.1 Gnk2-homologous domain [Arabidopsis suecica]
MISISILGDVVVFSGDNSIYVKLQCRGDSSTSTCRSCLDTAFSGDVSGDAKSFNEKTRTLLYKLKEKASSKENIPNKKNYLYATGEESLGKMKLYAMVQCTQDLSIKNCSVCLNWILGKLPKCCNGKQGGRFLSTSCNFRYELYPFVKLTTI